MLANSLVVTPFECAENQHIYHMYVIQAPRRDELQAWLKEHGIGTGIHYPVPIHLQNAIGNLKVERTDLPVTENTVNKILSLPMYPELTSNQINYVVDTIKSFYSESH
jgi:hypothetical protein